MKKTSLLVTFFLSFVLLGCGSEEASQQATMRQAVAIESADECHLCGMIISNFPGPKGELYEKGKEEVKKFCSNRDLFTYLLQPENRRQVQQVFVHDMTQVPWESPDDDLFIDAKSAWYVVGSSKKAAMGMAVASFSKEKHARFFSDQFGGEVIRFDDITIDMLAMGSGMHMSH